MIADNNRFNKRNIIIDQAVFECELSSFISFPCWWIQINLAIFLTFHSPLYCPLLTCIQVLHHSWMEQFNLGSFFKGHLS